MDTGEIVAVLGAVAGLLRAITMLVRAIRSRTATDEPDGEHDEPRERVPA